MTSVANAARPVATVQRRDVLGEFETTLANTALFAAHLQPPQIEGETIALPLVQDEVQHFLAWQAVQQGGHAGLVVGRPFDRRRKVPLPYTGFEGYFAFLGRPDEIASDRLLSQLERELNLAPDYSPAFQAHSRPTNGAAVVHTIARLGAQALEGIDRHCAEQSDPDAYWLACEGVLTGRRFDPALSLAAVEDLSALLGEMVAALRALGVGLKGACDAFRTATYAAIVPDLVYLVEGGAYVRRYTLARFPTSERPTNVQLSVRQWSGYRFMARIGAVGDPLLRSALRTLAPS